MKGPGAAWLEFEVRPEGMGSRLVQTAVFAPHGLSGQLYWSLLYPIHAYIFGRMVARLAAMADPSPREADA
jgi:hypothetical protein